MKLYEFAPTRSIRVRWTLQELGVDFESIPVNLMAGEHRRPEFLEINPAGKVPVLVDGDLVLTESVAIVLYLAEKYPDKGLVPTDLRARAQVNQWLLFAVTELEQPLWRVSPTRPREIGVAIGRDRPSYRLNPPRAGFGAGGAERAGARCVARRRGRMSARRWPSATAARSWKRT